LKEIIPGVGVRIPGVGVRIQGMEIE